MYSAVFVPLHFRHAKACELLRSGVTVVVSEMRVAAQHHLVINGGGALRLAVCDTVIASWETLIIRIE